jgi:hypothetical protein
MQTETMTTTGAEFRGPKSNITGKIYTSDAPAKKKIIAPPIRYDLRVADVSTVYQHIKELTKDDQAASQYLAQIQPALYSTAPNSIVFGYIPAPPNPAITRQIIGTNGHYFKMTTTICGIYFIWHDKTTNTFLFWGPSTFRTVKAMNSIYWRIVKYYEMAKEAQVKEAAAAAATNDDDDEDDDDDYSDMPDLISMGNTPDHEHPEQS